MLALAAIFGLVLFILAGAVYVIFQSNVASFAFKLDRTRAQFAAEAGVSLALHTLSLADSVPGGREPFALPGDSAQWISLPSGESVWVLIDPSDQNYLPCRIGSVEIRARGLSNGLMRDVSVRALPDYPSRYSLLVDAGVPAGFLDDGCIMAGPVHSNGPVSFSSESPDSADDPWVASVSTTARGGFLFDDFGRSDLPHPPGSRTWVRPYPQMLQGRPYWDGAADSVSFSRLTACFETLSAEASRQGSLIRGARRVLLDGRRLLYSAGPGMQVDTLGLGGRSIVYIQSGFAPVYMKSLGAVDQPLTIVVGGPLVVMGPISSQSAYSGSPLALVSLGDIIVAADPDASGAPDWPRPWDITTDRHLSIGAYLACPSGSLEAEDPSAGGGRFSLNVLGGLLEERFGSLETGFSGYELTIAWDEGYASVHPPGFPTLEAWKMISWQLDPDFGDGRIDDNIF